MNKLRRLFLTSIFIAASSLAMAQEARQPDTVVELFTSQGCSSCPPADAILGELVKRSDVLGLSFSVTYWNYIGWPDTFGHPLNDARQTKYRDMMAARYVYTPQMVVAGQQHFVGSNENQLEDILHTFKGHAKALKLNWRFVGKYLEIDLPNAASKATIWQLDLDREQTVKIRRGENRGKNLAYHNVVRKIQKLQDWDGKKQTLKLNLETLMAEGRDRCALLIQENGYGPIVAALVIDL